jgi:hypothetical protein
MTGDGVGRLGLGRMWAKSRDDLGGSPMPQDFGWWSGSLLAQLCIKEAILGFQLAPR